MGCDEGRSSNSLSPVAVDATDAHPLCPAVLEDGRSMTVTKDANLRADVDQMRAQEHEAKSIVEAEVVRRVELELRRRNEDAAKRLAEAEKAPKRTPEETKRSAEVSVAAQKAEEEHRRAME